MSVPKDISMTNVNPQSNPSGNKSIRSLGKYRDIVVAVAFFLVFDMAVLAVNFYTSFQISEDAERINIAGRQRMLSQRTAKTLFSLEAQHRQGAPIANDLEELSNTTKTFDRTLIGFQKGGEVPSADGRTIYLEPVGLRQQSTLEQAQSIWGPYKNLIAPVLEGDATTDEISDAVQYARENNVKLLGFMNDLTIALEAESAQLAKNLRTVQTVGIALALVNFAFILFKFLRRLRTSDALVEAANQENEEILSNVQEGLFLITPDFKVGSQVSKSSSALFGQAFTPNESFFTLLEKFISSKNLQDAKGYVELLFSSHVTETLIQSINPLSEVAVKVTNRRGVEEERYLSFNFNRVYFQDKAIRHLLVTVQDISQRVKLQKQLQQSDERARQEFAMLLKAFSTDPLLMKQFIERANLRLLEVNEILRGTAATQNEVSTIKALDGAARRIHAIKGDASMLGLDSLTSQVHQFETHLQNIRNSGGTFAQLGEALLSLPMQLDDLMSKISELNSFTQMRSGNEGSSDSNFAVQDIGQKLKSMVRKIAADQGKSADATIRMGSLFDLPVDKQNVVREIAIQLVRNSVAHGVEAPHVRTSIGKPRMGSITATLRRHSDRWELAVSDDGGGIRIERVRARLIELGWFTRTQVEGMTEQQLTQNIFKPGFSTASQVSEHAGRGAGLDLVATAVKELGGNLSLNSETGASTKFIINFSA